ncbi:RpiB/LacA/LacB family sugar-phosphate isomerase, partial [Candidatus Dependentiae bacterium]|nr:RpiB/LacA/LacB family sugar-phosphate isomerase [Candidatus Dependentiae bacterium]
IGMSIAANRVKGIYAGLCWSPAVATVAKENDGINVLVLPANFLTTEEAFAVIAAWLGASFKGGRHQERLCELDALVE